MNLSEIAMLSKIYVKESLSGATMQRTAALKMYSNFEYKYFNFSMYTPADIKIFNTLHVGKYYKFDRILMDGDCYVENIRPLMNSIRTQIVGIINIEDKKYAVSERGNLFIIDDYFNESYMNAPIILTYSPITAEIISYERA